MTELITLMAIFCGALIFYAGYLTGADKLERKKNKDSEYKKNSTFDMPTKMFKYTRESLKKAFKEKEEETKEDDGDDNINYFYR